VQKFGKHQWKQFIANLDLYRASENSAG